MTPLLAAVPVILAVGLFMAGVIVGGGALVLFVARALDKLVSDQ